MTMRRRRDHSEGEPELISRLRGGDVSAFEDLTRIHIRSVLRYAATVVTHRDDVEDVTQEVLLVAWRRRKDLDPARSALPWLLVTTRYMSLAANRRRVRNDADELESVPALQEWEHGRGKREAIDELDALHEVLDGLSPMDQELVQLCLVQGRSFEEASTAVGLKPPAARKRMQRLRERFHAQRHSAADPRYES